MATRSAVRLLVPLCVLLLAALPAPAAGGQADREQHGDRVAPAGPVVAHRAAESHDGERERGRRGPRSEQAPAERAKAFLERRSPDGASALPMERYLKALDQMELVPQYSTSAGQLLPSRMEMARKRTGGPGMLSATATALGTWEWLGPGNVGGRTRAILIHPTIPSTMYAAGVTGGIWKSLDSGASWAPLADLMANIAVCTLAMDPYDPNVIYAGTGEIFGSPLNLRGAGIFKSTNGGSAWA